MGNKNTCRWPVHLVISVPKIFLNRQFYFNLSSQTWSHVFFGTQCRMIGLPYGKNLWQYVTPFSSNTGTSRTDERTDRQTDRFAVSISRVSVLCADARQKLPCIFHVSFKNFHVSLYHYNPQSYMLSD